MPSADRGLAGKETALDIRDLRSPLECIRLVRRTAVQTTSRMITTGIMLTLLAGIDLTPADVYFGRATSIQQTIRQRRLLHKQSAA